MPKIKRLSLHEAQKIAAGEVVDRPANVVKELVENALDAGATQISVYIEKAGKKLIRIVDNGCGMDQEDAHACFEQHATSKIKTVEELHHIATFGFRGEALPSIAAVSTITLITKEAVADHGYCVELSHGTIQNTSITACPTGTDIAIAHLFDNVPARKKFLKTDDTEWRAITHLVHAFCLDYTGVHFKLFHDNKQIINCPITDSLEQRIAQLWDSPVAQSMLSFCASSPDGTFSIRGTTSHHQFYRYDRNSIYVFVNRRWVKNHQLTNAIIKGYQNVLPQGRFPAACLFVEIDPTMVDINIHPRKEEVSFLHPIKVTNLIQATIKQRLEQHLSSHLKKEVSLAAPEPAQSFLQRIAQRPSVSKAFTPFDFERFTQQPQMAPQTTHLYTGKTAASFKDAFIDQEPFNDSAATIIKSPPTTPPTVDDPTPKVADQQSVLPELNTTIQQTTVQEATHTIIGQYHTTYILLEHAEGLFVVDQHAAHERVLYELFAKRFHEVATTNLLFPVFISLSEEETNTLEEHTALFAEHGITISRFSRNQIVVESLPIHLKNSSLDDLFKQVVAWIHEYHHLEPSLFFKTVHERLRAQMACKAAIKAGDTLSMEQMKQLLKDLDQTENRLTCPHGRPTGWLLSLYEIEKKFKRKL